MSEAGTNDDTVEPEDDAAKDNQHVTIAGKGQP